MQYLFQGLLLGLAYVAPIGTQNMFVINTALTQKRKRVLLTALIVFFFDATLAIACFYGAGALISAHEIVQLVVVGIGGLVVIWLGIGLIRSKSTLDTGVDTNIPVGKIITTACVVTWFNPHAIIDGTAIFGTQRSVLPAAAGTMFIIGVCCASCLWWFGMSTIVNLFRAKFTDKLLRIINIVCGIIIVFYGCKLLYSGIQLLQEMN